MLKFLDFYFNLCCLQGCIFLLSPPPPVRGGRKFSPGKRIQEKMCTQRGKKGKKRKRGEKRKKGKKKENRERKKGEEKRNKEGKGRKTL